MLKNFLTGFLSVLCSAALMGAEPVVTVKAPALPGGEIKLVDRDSLRAPAGTKRAAIDKSFRVFRATTDAATSTWDWSKKETIPAPMLKNNVYGICYPSAALKFFAFTNINAVGGSFVYDEAALVKWYLSASGGDNGMSDSQMFPAMTRGFIPPNGKHKILDRAIVSATDETAIATMAGDFGPLILTFIVYQSMMNNTGPGAVWDANSGGVVGGHAVLLDGKDAKGYKIETWAVRPRITMTKRCLDTCDPEVISFFSLEWFDPKTGLAPNGKHYVELAAEWTRFTGTVLPPNPFPPPVGPMPPVPPLPPTPPVPTPPVPPTPGPSGAITVTVGGDSISIDPASKTVALPPGWAAGKFHGPEPVVYPRDRFTSTSGMTYEMCDDGYYRAVGSASPGTLPVGVAPIVNQSFTPLRTVFQNGRMVLQGCVGGFCPQR